MIRPSICSRVSADLIAEWGCLDRVPGFIHKCEVDEVMGEVDVWTLELGVRVDYAVDGHGRR